MIILKVVSITLNIIFGQRFLVTILSTEKIGKCIVSCEFELRKHVFNYSNPCFKCLWEVLEQLIKYWQWQESRITNIKHRKKKKICTSTLQPWLFHEYNCYTKIFVLICWVHSEQHLIYSTRGLRGKGQWTMVSFIFTC